MLLNPCLILASTLRETLRSKELIIEERDILIASQNRDIKEVQRVRRSPLLLLSYRYECSVSSALFKITCITVSSSIEIWLFKMSRTHSSVVQ